jgi:hypothetical protein
MGVLAASPMANANEAQSDNAVLSQQQAKDRNEQVTTKGVKPSNANMILVGELIDSRDVTLKGVNEDKHRLLKVKPGNGTQTVIVDIGRQDSVASFGLVKGDRVIAVGKSARINDRPVLFAKSIGEIYPVGRLGSVARDPEQIKQDESARGPAATGNTESRTAEGAATRDSSEMTKAANKPSEEKSAASIDVPDVRKVDEIVVWFDSDNLGSDQYGTFDKDFVWVTFDPEYSSWNPTGNAMAWNDNWETPHWDVWGYDDADEWGLFDW